MGCASTSTSTSESASEALEQGHFELDHSLVHVPVSKRGEDLVVVGFFRDLKHNHTSCSQIL